jgi:diguanylate cyclase (GGDEF)-like protein
VTRISRDANRRILVIDDSPAIHQDFRKILRPDTGQDDALAVSEAALFGEALQPKALRRFELDSAYQGQEALAMVELAVREDRPYAMAFVDMRMPPGWNGVETIEHLWRADPQLQIALCTAYSDFSWETIADRLGSTDRLLILKKPFDAIEIQQMAGALTAKWQMTQDAAMKLSSLEKAAEERALEQMKLSRRLHYDALTDLANGTLLEDRLTQAIAISRRHRKQLVVIWLGIDRFRQINNALGHAAGDELLREVAELLVNTVRRSDSVFRLGADQFVLLMGDVSHPEQTFGIAEKLLASLRGPYRIADQDLGITASLGISLYPDDGEDALSLTKKAETAMHDAKENGRDGFRFYITDMNHRAREQQSMEAGLRDALEHRAFALHYQPQVALETGVIVGAEALIRWHSPLHGPIAPSQFIPVAERSGLIVPISRWVLHEACRQARAWQVAGLPAICMAVNVSAIDFRQKDFLHGIRAALEETRLAADSLELEITEGVLMRDIEATVAILHELKDLGVRLAIDDFGTGYSSLSYLRQFPVDVLKIDQSFVRGITTSTKDAALVDAIISMGRSLGLSIIAEGVESQAQHDFLRGHHCDQGQGFLFGHSVMPEEFADLLRQGSRHKLTSSV